MKFPTVFRWRINQKYFQIGIYLITLLHLVEIRRDLDHKHIFITSDGQIKYYQTLQMAEGEFRNSECLYPGLELDPEYKYYLFDYPWAFFHSNGLKCAFQYSPYFPWIGSIFYRYLGEKFVTFTPLLFWFLSILVFERVLHSLGVRFWISLLVAISLFWGGFLSLSALDYAEFTLNDFLALVGIWGYVRFFSSVQSVHNSNQKLVSWKEIFYLIAAILGLFSSILLRPEGMVGIGIFLGLGIFFFWNQIVALFSNFRFWMVSIVSFSLLVGFYLLVNTLYSQNPLGFRISNTGKDLQTLYDLSSIWSGWIADLWKSDFKTGLFFAFPALFLFPLLLLFPIQFHKDALSLDSIQKKFGYQFLGSGFMSCLLIPLLSPYRAGYHHFGNRYFEVAVVLFFLGIAILWNQVLNFPKSLKSFPNPYKAFKIFSIFLVVSYFLFSYMSLRYTKEGWKVLKQSASLYSQLQDLLNEIGRASDSQQKIPIVHKSLFTNYLVGVSFLDRAQFLTVSKNEMQKLEEIFQEAGIREYLVLEYMGTPRYMSDIPKKLYEEKINVRYESPKDRFLDGEKKDFLEFQIKRRIRK